MTLDRVTRRSVLAGAAALGISRPALAQATRPVKFGLSWLPEGASNLFAYVGKAQGYWKKRGLEVELGNSRGSIASAQAVANSQYDFALSAAPSLLVLIARGASFSIIGQSDYLMTMGIGVLADSPIRKPQDLAGKSIGSPQGTVDQPFLLPFLKANGVDPASVKIVQVDPQVRDRLLVERQVDAISSVAATTIPPLVPRKIETRFMLYADHGLGRALYSQSFITLPATLERDPGLCEAFVDGALEAIRFTLTDPQASLDIFLREVKELALTTGAREAAQIGLEMFTRAMLSDEARDRGLGYIDVVKYQSLAEAIVAYATPGTAVPAVDKLITNRFAGKLKLTPAEWQAAERRIERTRQWY